MEDELHKSVDSQALKREESRKKEMAEVREKLQALEDQIIFNTAFPFDRADYPDLFKYKVYEAYKPLTLRHMKEYIGFLLHGNLAPDLERYYEGMLSTQLPAYVNQRLLLQFDSNFECGNLDSAYVVREHQYSLLMKMDTNTRGNCIWFYFKVRNGTPDVTVKFNVLNFSRRIDFYEKGMGVMVRRGREGPWEGNLC